MSSDSRYYAARANVERRLAMASADLRVRRIHLELAAQYDGKASGKATVDPSPAEAEDLRSA